MDRSDRGGRPCACVDERSHDLTLAPWTKIDACHSGIKEWYPALVGCRGSRPGWTRSELSEPPGERGGYDMELEALDHVGINVADVERSIRWYRDVLGLRRVHEEAWGDFPAVLEANGSGVALFPRDAAPATPGARADDDMSHVGFRTSRRGLEQAKAEIRALGIDHHEGDYGVAWSVYFDDPDGHQIEVTTYEAPEG